MPATQSSEQPGWDALSYAVRIARMEKGFAQRSAFARSLGIDDSTLKVIEGVRTGRVSEQMLDYLAVHLDWPIGMWRFLLETADPGVAQRRDGADDALAHATDVELLKAIAHRVAQKEQAAQEQTGSG